MASPKQVGRGSITQYTRVFCLERYPCCLSSSILGSCYKRQKLYRYDLSSIFVECFEITVMIKNREKLKNESSFCLVRCTHPPPARYFLSCTRYPFPPFPSTMISVTRLLWVRNSWAVKLQLGRINHVVFSSSCRLGKVIFK